jgi:thiol:disulfide interchange protein
VLFRSGLALPFFLLALFPSYLKKLPRSGGWMMRIKVVMGFIILAASLKYFSSLDQVMQWGLLTRERFLAAWVVLFAMAGLYLLGILRMEGIKADQNVGLGRLLTGMAFLAFAITLLPGMFGGKLGELDAYVPEASAGSSAGSTGRAELVWLKNDYSSALAQARGSGKLVFVDFTGYACTNCHWMRANMFSRPEVSSALGGFVLAELYTDGTDAASEANAQLELTRFKTTAIPFYAIMDADENVIATSAGVTRDPAAFLAFLNKGAKPAAPVEAPTVNAAGPAQAPPDSASVTAPAKKAEAGILPGVKTLAGAPLDAQAFAGKVAVVNFWATWCVPCIQEIPGFNKLHHDLAAKGVAVLGVSMDEEGRERVDPFLKKHPIEYPVALGPDALNAKYSLDSLPVTLVFDRTGKQVKRFEGFTEEAALRAAIQPLL